MWLKAFTGFAVCSLVTSAFAQPAGFGRAKTPTVSPYLNLLNRGAPTAFNYYQLYRPQTEFRNAYQNLNQNLNQAENQLREQAKAIEEIGSVVRPGASLRATGHPTSFMSYGGYFPAR